MAGHIPGGFVPGEVGSVSAAGSSQVSGTAGLCLLWCGQSPGDPLRVQGTGSKKRARGAGGLPEVFIVLSDPDRAAGQVTGKWHKVCRSTAPGTEGWEALPRVPLSNLTRALGGSRQPRQGLRHRERQWLGQGSGQANATGRALPALGPGLQLLPLRQQSRSSSRSLCWAQEQGPGSTGRLPSPSGAAWEAAAAGTGGVQTFPDSFSSQVSPGSAPLFLVQADRRSGGA